MKRALVSLLPVVVVAAAAAFFLLRDRDADDPLLGTDLAHDETARGPAEARLEGRGVVSAPPVPTATGFVLQGRVVDEAGKGVGGVPVVARPVTYTQRHQTSQVLDNAYEGAVDPGDPVEAVTSAADGTFALRSLAADGRWSLEARPAPPRVGSTQSIWLDRRPGAAPDVRLVVRDGSPLRVRVVDATGAGLTAFVSASGPLKDRRAFSWSQRALPTDGDGRLTIPAVPAPDLMLTVRVPRRAQKAGVRIETPTSEEIVVRIGERDGARVSGRVLGSDGEAIAGARVLVRVAENPKLYWEGERTEAIATSAPDGTYEVSGLPALYLESLHADAPGHCPRSIPRVAEQLAAGQTVTVDVVLLKGGVVGGRVLTSGGTPVADAMVSVAGMPTLHDGQHRADGVSDGQGNYLIESLPPGAAVLAVHAEGYFLPDLLPGRYGRSARGVSITVAEEGAVVEQDLVLARGIPVHGRVVDERGEPAAGAQVAASSTATRPTGGVRVPLPRATAGADGHFAFAGLTPAPDWMFQARAGERCSAWSTAQSLAEDQAEPLVLDLTVRPGATLAGRVLDDADQPVAGVTVGLQPQHAAQQAETDTDGRFAFRGLPADTYQLHIYRRPWMRERPPPVEVSLEWGEVSEDTVLRTVTGLRVAGIVVDEAGEPVPGQTLWLQLLEGDLRRPVHYLRSGVDGHFEIEGVAPGRYALRIEGSEESMDIEAGDEDVRVVAPASARAVLEGVVLDPEGEPLAKGSLLVSWPYPGGGTRGEHTVVTDGRFRVEVPGEKGISLELKSATDLAGRPLNVRMQKREDVDAGQSPITIRLEEGYFVAGRVVDAAGKGVAGAQVQIAHGSTRFPPMPFGQSTTSGQDGAFRIVGLDPADGQLQVQPPPAYAPPPPVPVQPSVEGVLVRLAAAARLEGRVVGPDDEPVAGAQVYAHWSVEDGISQSQRTTTDTDGRFRLEGLGSEPLRLYVSQPHSQGGRWEYLPVNLQDIDPTQTDLVVRLERGVWIEGHVFGPDGSPAEEGSVSVLVSSLLEGARRRSESANVGPAGAFAVGPIPPGPCRLTASGQGAELRPSEPVEVEAPAEGVRLHLRKGWTIEGRLQGADVEGFQVTLRYPLDGRNHRSTGNRTDATGRFVFGGLEEGTAGTIHAWRKDDDRYALLADVRAGGPAYDLDLKAGRTISGHLEGTVAEGGAKAQVTAKGPHGISVYARLDGSESRTFELRGLPPGTWTLSGYVWGDSATRLGPVEVEAGATDVVLRPVPK